MTDLTIPPLSPFPGRGAAPEDYIAQADTTMQQLPGVVAGIQAVSDAFNLGTGVLSVGYLPPVAYAAGIAMTLALQQVEYGGVTYAPLLAALPFTTSGVFEVAKFRVVQGVTTAAMSEETARTFTQITGDETDRFGEFASALRSGIAVLIGAFGDSSFAGYLSGPVDSPSSYTAVPSPLAFQNTMNAFFGNAALTVENRAISGTSCEQMIAGTDGSGSTFESKMAVSPALIILCNHGINDNNNSGGSPQGYRASLIEFVRICRKYNKAPVLVTPFACLAFGDSDTFRLAQRGPMFAGIMRSVAHEFGVKLLDNYAYSAAMLSSGDFNPYDLLPDGVHGSPFMYEQMGRNLVSILLDLPPIDATGYQSAVSGFLSGNNVVFNKLAGSKFRSVAVNNADVSNNGSLKVLVNVGRGGCDLAFAGLFWSGGSKSVVCTVDGPTFGVTATLPTFKTGTWGNATSVFDLETTIATKLPAGVHLITLTSTAQINGSAICLAYMRAIENRCRVNVEGANPDTLYNSASFASQINSPVNDVAMYPDMPTHRLLENLTVQFEAKFVGGTGFVIHAARMGKAVDLTYSIAKCLIVWQRADDHLIISELVNEVNTLDYDLGSHPEVSTQINKFSVNVTKAGTGTNGAGIATVTLNGVALTSANLTIPIYGGNVGIWSSVAGVAAIANNVRVLKDRS